jgi:16S rRNA (uracil1498-N3)-methyltransferase
LARRRFFVDHVHGDRAELTGKDARHLARVLRAEPGQRYELSDNRQAYLADITDVNPARVTFRILEPLPAPPPSLRITLYSALFKFDRFEWLIEKATELGAARIVPVNAERTEKGLTTAASKRIERWRKIARESSQQSRRLSIPEITAAAAFTAAIADSSPHRFLLEEQAGAPPLAARLSVVTREPNINLAVLTGPEGGWTDRERILATGSGWQPVSLGPHILRAETAAVAALAVLAQAC